MRICKMDYEKEIEKIEEDFKQTKFLFDNKIIDEDMFNLLKNKKNKKIKDLR